MILLRLSFVHNVREITGLWIADYNRLFLFFVVACSQACLSWTEQTPPQPHGSQFSYCGSFGHLDSVRKFLMTRDETIYAQILGRACCLLGKEGLTE